MTNAERHRLWESLDRIAAKLDQYREMKHPLVVDMRIVMKLAIQGEKLRSLMECDE